MEQPMAQQPMLQHEVPVATMPQVPQPMMPKSSPRRTGIILVTAIAVILILGSYAGAAYFLHWWPFGTLVPKGKQQAFMGLFEKIQAIESASYQAKLSVAVENREANAQTFEQAVTDFDDEVQALQRDQNTFRDVELILKTLRPYLSRGEAYPARLGDVPTLANRQFPNLTYAVKGNDFILTATFETKQAIDTAQRAQYYDTGQVSQNSGSTNQEKTRNAVEGMRVTFTSASTYPFYFHAQPQRPAWVSFYESDLISGVSWLSSDFSLQVNANGISERAPQSSDTQFQVGGDLKLGDLSVAADAQFTKKDDDYYVRLNKFPSVFMDLSAVKEKWIKITPEDLIGYSDYLDAASYLSEGSSRTKEVVPQLQLILKTMNDEGVMQVDFSLPDEVQGDERKYVYQVSLVPEKIPGWYEKLMYQLKETYGEKAILKLDQKTLDFMKKPIFGKYIAYIQSNASFRIVVDPKTGFPVRFDYTMRYIPSDPSASPSAEYYDYGYRSSNLKDKQIRVMLSTALSDINKKIEVQVPNESISYEEAQIALTGISKESYRFNKQVSNIRALRSALAAFKRYTGAFPGSLDDLKKKRGEVQKTSYLDDRRMSVFSYILQGPWNLLANLQNLVAINTAQAQVSIDFPQEFDGFSEDYDSYQEYDYYDDLSVDAQAKLLDKPFMKIVPRDVYGGGSYVYRTVEGADGYALEYTLALPTRARNDAGEPSGYGYAVSGGVSSYMKYVSGVNTATATVESREAKTAQEIDSDGDTLPDSVEGYYGSDPNKEDSDNDGYKDGDEAAKGYDPAGPGKLGYNDTWYPPYKPYDSNIIVGPTVPACKLESEKVAVSEKCCYGLEASGGVCVRSKPDLRIANIVSAGTAFKVTICNDGKANVASPAFTTVANGRSDKLIVPALSAGSCATYQTHGYSTFGIPEKWTGVVEVTADKDQAVVESNETNNTLKQSITVALSFGCAEGSPAAADPYFYGTTPAEGVAAIVVTSPKHGSVLERNKPYIITWETKNFTASKVNIYLDDLCGSSSFIARDIANEGNYPWNVDTVDPISLVTTSMAVPPSKYRLYITSNQSNNTANTQVIGTAGYITIK